VVDPRDFVDLYSKSKTKDCSLSILIILLIIKTIIYAKKKYNVNRMLKREELLLD